MVQDRMEQWLAIVVSRSGRSSSSAAAMAVACAAVLHNLCRCEVLCAVNNFVCHVHETSPSHMVVKGSQMMYCKFGMKLRTCY